MTATSMPMPRDAQAGRAPSADPAAAVRTAAASAMREGEKPSRTAFPLCEDLPRTEKSAGGGAYSKGLPQTPSGRRDSAAF